MKPALFSLILVPAIALGAIASCDAAGIDCSRAADNVDMAICDLPDLKRLDGELADAYREAMQRTPRRQELLGTQRRFIEARRACARVDCIYARTYERIRLLERWR